LGKDDWAVLKKGAILILFRTGRGIFMSNSTIGDDMKKILLAGLGAVAVTAEKSKELVDKLAKKGEITWEQSKVLNEELTQKMKKTYDEKIAPIFAESKTKVDNVVDNLRTMTREQLKTVREQIEAMEKADEETRDGDDVGGGKDE
jgi:polyhydroxyalkanoate synthesis regulator phasin